MFILGIAFWLVGGVFTFFTMLHLFTMLEKGRRWRYGYDLVVAPDGTIVPIDDFVNPHECYRPRFVPPEPTCSTAATAA